MGNVTEASHLNGQALQIQGPFEFAWRTAGAWDQLLGDLFPSCVMDNNLPAAGHDNHELLGHQAG